MGGRKPYRKHLKAFQGHRYPMPLCIETSETTPHFQTSLPQCFVYNAEYVVYPNGMRQAPTPAILTSVYLSVHLFFTRHFRWCRVSMNLHVLLSSDHLNMARKRSKSPRYFRFTVRLSWIPQVMFLLAFHLNPPVKVLIKSYSCY